MAKNKVEITGINTKDIIVLKKDEMHELFKKTRNGDSKARELLVEGNLKLVLSILKKFTSRIDNMDDLFQIGCVGLVKAIDNFDLSYDVKFSTYAVPMIEGEIRRYLRDNTSLRISRSLKDIAYKSLKFQDEYLKEYGKMPDYEQIALKLGVSNYDVMLALESLKDPVSMYEAIYNDGGDTIYVCDQIEDKKTNSKDIELRISVNDAISKLNEREQFILDERFVVGKTQMEVADELMISQAQVSRLEHNAIKQLKKVLH
ncbi:MAG: SigB/SigF/SigG family RNA polymerase sigma factor [Bacilli bacterium]|nr:SigB/SigF/SigG family RNA polymerase sigma factor [Bacilli bacterium]